MNLHHLAVMVKLVIRDASISGMYLRSYCYNLQLGPAIVLVAPRLFVIALLLILRHSLLNQSILGALNFGEELIIHLL